MKMVFIFIMPLLQSPCQTYVPNLQCDFMPPSASNSPSPKVPSVPERRPPKSLAPVLEALHTVPHATVQDVLDAVNRQPGLVKKLSQTTVYRALNTLVESGQVKPIHFNDGQVRYELNFDHPSHGDHDCKHHHHHFFCTACKAIIELDDCALAPYLDTLGQRFQVQYHNLEIAGLCERCR